MFIFWYRYNFLSAIEIYAKKGKCLNRLTTESEGFLDLFLSLTGIYYNASLFCYCNNHLAEELSYQKTIGKLFCQYVLYDHRGQAGAKITEN